MKRIHCLALVISLLSLLAPIANAETHSHVKNPDPSWDPKDAEIHMAYEWATYTPGQPKTQRPGAVLTGPGDSYSYTVLRNDQYADNPDYEVVWAIIGVHIDDSVPGKASKKWAKILVNNKARSFIVEHKKDKRKSKPSHLVEVISDATLTGDPNSSTPPFIYDVTDLIKAGKLVRISVTNLRADGQVDGDAAFGGFVVNRVGAHVWYKKKR